jgi:ABC-2 type transport system permease protein
MIKYLLALLTRFRWLFEGLGVDFPRFLAILEVKLTMDTRRRQSGHVERRGRKPANYFAMSLLMNVFMGTFVGFVLSEAGSPLVAMTLLHTFVMIMITFSLISDFTSVLLDPTDNVVLQPRPVDSRTVLVARVTHIVVYISLVALSLSACSLFVGSASLHPAFALVYLPTLFCSVVLVVFAVHVVYLLALRHTNIERFRDLVLYAQIAMMAIVFGGYQLLPRLHDFTQLKDMTIADASWIYLYPPAWMAAPVDVLCGQIDGTRIILSVLGVVVPVAALLLVVRVLSPGFNQALAQLDQQDRRSDRDADDRTDRGAPGSRAARWLTRPGPQRAAFEMVWQLCSRDRAFKQRSYPSIAFVLILSGVMMASDLKHVSDIFTVLPGTHKHLLLLYFTCALSPTALISLKYSAQFEAAWWYYALPLQHPGTVLLAAAKVVFARLVLPFYLFVSMIVLAIWGSAAIIDILLGFCGLLAVSGFQAMLFGRELPFSRQYLATEGGGRLGRSLLFFSFPASVGGLHLLLRLHAPEFVPVAILPVLLIALLLARSYARTSWAAVLRASA